MIENIAKWILLMVALAVVVIIVSVVVWVVTGIVKWFREERRKRNG